MEHGEVRHHAGDRCGRITWRWACGDAARLPQQMQRIEHREPGRRIRDVLQGGHQKKDERPLATEATQVRHHGCCSIKVQIVQEIPREDDVEVGSAVVGKKQVGDAVGLGSILHKRERMRTQGIVQIFDIKLAGELGELGNVGPNGWAKIE